MTTRRSILLCAALTLVLALPSAASAKIGVAVGLGDQNASIFDQSAFQALGVKKVRYFIKWNAASDPYQLQQADIYVTRAMAAGDTVFMTPSSDDLRLRKAKLPSVAAYKRDVGKLVKRYRALGVTEWGAWNEENHPSQPTYRSPRRAAQYFQAMYGLCRGCTIVALDILDQARVADYVGQFYRSLSGTWRSRADLVGIHDYEDVNYKRSTGTQSIITATHAHGRNSRAHFWLTETGGLVGFGSNFPCSRSRAADRISYMFSLAKKFNRYLDRMYAYAYWGNDCRARFDAGLVNRNGTRRVGYTVFKKAAASFQR